MILYLNGYSKIMDPRRRTSRVGTISILEFWKFGHRRHQWHYRPTHICALLMDYFATSEHLGPSLIAFLTTGQESWDPPALTMSVQHPTRHFLKCTTTTYVFEPVCFQDVVSCNYLATLCGWYKVIINVHHYDEAKPEFLL